jgi:hypothetical protein
VTALLDDLRAPATWVTVTVILLAVAGATIHIGF